MNVRGGSRNLAKHRPQHHDNFEGYNTSMTVDVNKTAVLFAYTILVNRSQRRCSTVPGLTSCLSCRVCSSSLCATVSSSPGSFHLHFPPPQPPSGGAPHLLFFPIALPHSLVPHPHHQPRHVLNIPLLHRRRLLLHAAHPSPLPRQCISLAPHNPRLLEQQFNLHGQLHRRRPRPPPSRCQQ